MALLGGDTSVTGPFPKDVLLLEADRVCTVKGGSKPELQKPVPEDAQSEEGEILARSTGSPPDGSPDT
jgi:hypothetical protein